MPSDRVKLSGTLRQARRTTTTAAAVNGVVKQQQSMIDSQFDVSFFEDDGQMIADKRTAHNALERQRRENLNTKFQELAHTLPGLQTVRRPSKSMIVTKSLEFVSQAKYREMRFQYQISQLYKQQQKLLSSENQLLEARPFKSRSDQAATAAIIANKLPFPTKESPPPTPESSLSGSNEVDVDDSTTVHPIGLSDNVERYMGQSPSANLTFDVPVCQPLNLPDSNEFHPIYWQNYPTMSPLMGANFCPYPEYPRKPMCGTDATDLLYGRLSTFC